MVFGRTGLSGGKVVKCRVAECFPEKSIWCLIEQVCQRVMVKCRVAEYFPEKSRWCLVEQVCQEVKWLNVGWLNTSQRSRDGVW